MRAALLRLCRRLRISWLRARRMQIDGAMNHMVLDPNPNAATALADLMLERIEINLRIQDLEAQL